MVKKNLVFTEQSWADYIYWINQDKKTLRKINKLIADVLRSPFEGIGKPEPLKENYSGFWSRRIDEKNRLVYSVTASTVNIICCRFHY